MISNSTESATSSNGIFQQVMQECTSNMLRSTKNDSNIPKPHHIKPLSQGRHCDQPLGSRHYEHKTATSFQSEWVFSNPGKLYRTKL